MSKWLAGGVVLLVFLSGLGVGSLGTLAFQHHSPGGRFPGHRFSGSGMVDQDHREHSAPRLLDQRFIRSLNLSKDQADQLEALHRQIEEKMAKVRPRVRSEVEGLRSSHLNEVRTILDEQQREHFDRMIARRERRHRQRMRRPPAEISE